MEALLKDSRFQKTLQVIADERGEALNVIMKEAAVYMKELYTEHQPIANVIGTEMMQFVLSRGYNKSIDVNASEIKQITKLSRRYSIAYVMTHKTYIDMMVLGLVLARHGLPLPYTFAGINMGFLGLAQFGRQNGVIFIRRSFKDNQVYKATLRHFIASLVKEKSDFMWAIEGTRSRTGKLVWPKMGILKYIREAEVHSRQEVKYIPVSIVYDLIPDVKEMTLEGRGKRKKSESLAWFIDYIRKMGDNFGKISLRFGPPVEIKTANLASTSEYTLSDTYQQGTIPRFSLELVHRINQITPVTTTSLVCIALLSKFALTKRAIEAHVSDFMQLIENRKSDVLVDRGRAIGQTVQSALNLLLRANLVKQQGDSLNAKFMVSVDNFLSATYYSNMAVHHFYHRAFIELALVKITKLDFRDRETAFWQGIMDLRDLFKFEFFYSRKENFTEEIESNMNLLDPNWMQLFQDENYDPTDILERQKLWVSQVVLDTYLQAYRVVGLALKNWDPDEEFNDKKLINNCIFLGEEMHWQGQIQRIESVSKPFLLNGIRLAKNLDLISDHGELRQDKIQDWIDELNYWSNRIQALQSLTLTQPVENLPTVPVERDIVPGSKTESITKDIIEGEAGAHIGAFFDLDRTLIKGFSAKEFFQTRLFSGRITAREIIAQFAGVLVYAAGNGNFAGLAAIGAQGVKGVNEQVFIEVGEEVYHKHLAEAIYPESRALVAAHMAKGHTVAIISAATPYQVDPISRDLGIEHVMCTRMEVEDGEFTGRIIEPACWGEGKAFAARELTEQFNLDLSKSYFYTDSAEDLPLLEIVGYPRPMNPDSKLSALAFQNDWPVYRFNDDERPGASNFVRTALALGSLVPAVVSGVRAGAMNLSWTEGVNSMMATVGDLVCAAAGINVVVKGQEYLFNTRPAVFILNHQSSADMFIASKLIRKDARGIAKKELQSMPIIGQLLAASGVIFIDRSNREQAIEAMKPAVDALQSGTSIIIFPEGTRSYGYKLGDFKKGAFHLAMQGGVPLIPIIIKNAHDAMPRGTNVFRPATVEVIVKPPISVEDWDGDNLNEKIAGVREMFLRELGQIELTK